MFCLIELRSQNKSVEEDIHNKCFMCGIERDTFERRANGFENHVKLDHNMWHYLYFNMYLRRKERTEYTGPEQYVADKVKFRSRSTSRSDLLTIFSRRSCNEIGYLCRH